MNEVLPEWYPYDPGLFRIQVKVQAGDKQFVYEDRANVGTTRFMDRNGERLKLLKELSLTVGQYAALSMMAAMVDSGFPETYPKVVRDPQGNVTVERARNIRLDVPEIPLEVWCKKLAYEIRSAFLGNSTPMDQIILGFMLDNPPPGMKAPKPDTQTKCSPEKPIEVPCLRAVDYSAL